MQNQTSGDEIPPPQRTRPLSVWLISIWYFLSGIFSINMIAMVRARLAAPSTVAEGIAMPSEIGPADLLLAALLIAVNLCGAGFLFILRKAAVHFFRAAVALNVGINAWYLITKGAGEKPAIMILSVALGLLVAVAVARHAQNLERNGVLR